MAKCPTCGSETGTWTDDPILTYDGLNGNEYRGFLQIQPKHIKELQDRNKEAEIAVSIPETDRTEFSSIYTVEDDESSYKPFICHKRFIKELRESTEKILEATNQTLEDFLNYDDEGTEIIFYEWHNDVRERLRSKTTWTDPDIDSGDFQVKAIHIEELRCQIDETIPMYKFNRGTSVTSTPLGDSIVNIMYNQKGQEWIGIWNMWVVQTILIDAKNGAPDDVGFPYMNYWDIEIVQSGEDCYTVDYWYWWWNPDPPPGHWEWRPYLGSRVALWTKVAGGIIWRAYRSQSTNSNYKIQLTCIPTRDNLNIEKYEMKELNGNPILIDETLGYPRIQYAGDSQVYARPKSKSTPFLEDVIANFGNEYNLTKLTYPSTVIFKDTTLSVNYGLSSVIEDAFDQRNMDSNSWGSSDPAWSIVGTSEYMRSVSFRGTVACGNCSIFVPKTWQLNRLEKYRENQELTWTFENDAGIHAGGQSCFRIELGSEHMIEGDVYDPSTGLYIPSHFGGNFLLAKDPAPILAKDWKELDHLLETGENSIELPENSIARSVDCWVDGELWKKVDDFTNSFDTDYHYKIESNTLYFGDGINGKLPSGLNIHIETYTDEITYTKYYPNGTIIVPYDLTLVGTSCYVYIEYYNTPSQYYTIDNPITQYNCSYWAKPATGNYDLGSGTWEAGHKLGALGGYSSGRYLPAQSALAWSYLSP
jgi:hypothetical protein